MKKIVLTIAAAVCIGAAAMAQTTPSGSSTPGMEQSGTTRSKDWSKVESSQVPSAVQQTLKDSKYKGWENSGVYYNKTTRQYSVDTKGNTGTTSMYTFDANGKAVTNSNMSGSSPSTSPSGTRPNGGSTGGSTPTTPNSPAPGSPTPNP